MVLRHYFSHVGPDGRSAPQRVRRSGYVRNRGGSTVGEALTWTADGGSPAMLVRVLMNSARHRRILLDPRYRDIGIGLALGAPRRGVQNAVTLTLNFGRRSRERVMLAPCAAARTILGATMTDDPIRELLAAIEPQPFWGPKGQTAILEQKVIEAGGDPDIVEQWVEAHGGRLDRTVPVLRRSVLSREAVPDVQRFYLVPDEALRSDAAAA